MTNQTLTNEQTQDAVMIKALIINLILYCILVAHFILHRINQTTPVKSHSPPFVFSDFGDSLKG